MSDQQRLFHYEAEIERLQTLADTRDMMLRQLRAQFDDMVRQRDAAIDKAGELLALLKPMVEHFRVGGGPTPIGKMLEDAYALIVKEEK